MGTYDIEMEMKADLEDLAQLSVTVYIDNIVKPIISIRGTKGEWIKETRDLGFFFGSNHYLKLYFGANGMQLGKIRLKLRRHGSAEQTRGINKKKYREKPEPGSRCLKAVPGSGFSYERRFL